MAEKDGGERKGKRAQPERENNHDRKITVVSRALQHSISGHRGQGREKTHRRHDGEIGNQMPVDVFRQTEAHARFQNREKESVGQNGDKTHPRRFRRINVILRRTGLFIVNDVGRIPPVLINQQGMVLNDGARLIEPGRLIMLSRLIKVGVGRPKQQKQEQFHPMPSQPIPCPIPDGKNHRCGRWNVFRKGIQVVRHSPMLTPSWLAGY